MTGVALDLDYGAATADSMALGANRIHPPTRLFGPRAGRGRSMHAAGGGVRPNSGPDLYFGEALA